MFSWHAPRVGGSIEDLLAVLIRKKTCGRVVLRMFAPAGNFYSQEGGLGITGRCGINATMSSRGWNQEVLIGALSLLTNKMKPSQIYSLHFEQAVADRSMRHEEPERQGVQSPFPNLDPGSRSTITLGRHITSDCRKRTEKYKHQLPFPPPFVVYQPPPDRPSTRISCSATTLSFSFPYLSSLFSYPRKGRGSVSLGRRRISQTRGRRATTTKGRRPTTTARVLRYKSS